MILGMSTATFTLLHVIISLIGIASGVIVVLSMLAPTQSEAPFIAAQLLVLAFFVWVGLRALKKFAIPVRSPAFG